MEEPTMMDEELITKHFILKDRIPLDIGFIGDITTDTEVTQNLLIHNIFFVEISIFYIKCYRAKNLSL